LRDGQDRHKATFFGTAIEALILVPESNGGPTMLARIGVMRAINRHVERVFTSRKDHHWGKRWRAIDDPLNLKGA
jgi:hypothetical protein